AHEIDLRVRELRLVERLLGDRLVERGLIGHRVYPGQHVALLDVLALDIVDAQERAVDERGDIGRVERLGGADAVEIDRHFGGLRGSGDDRNWTTGVAPAGESLLLLLDLPAAEYRQAADDERADKGNSHQSPKDRFHRKP